MTAGHHLETIEDSLKEMRRQIDWPFARGPKEYEDGMKAIARVSAILEMTEGLLQRLSEWDMLYVSPDGVGVTADGAYWQAQIAIVRAAASVGGPEGEQ